MKCIAHKKGLRQLPPTSYSLPGHFLWFYYFVNFCLTLEQSLLQNNSIHSPLNFGWKSVNGILLSNKYLQTMPTQYVTKCVSKKVAQNIGMHKLQNVSFCKKTANLNEYFYISSLMLLWQLLVLMFHMVFLIVYHLFLMMNMTIFKKVIFPPPSTLPHQATIFNTPFSQTCTHYLHVYPFFFGFA